MAMNTPYLSDITTGLTGSGLSVAGTLNVAGAATLSGALNSASAISGGAITGTTGTFSGAVNAASTLSARGNVTFSGVGPLTLVSASSFSLAATTITGNKSLYTSLTVNAVALGDFVQVCPVSSLSSDIILTAEASANSTILLRMSNVSGTQAAQTALPVRYMVWRGASGSGF